MTRPPVPRRRRFARFRPRLEGLEARALMAYAGSLDPTFGGGMGYYVGAVNLSSLGESLSQLPNPTSVAVEADGSVIVAVPDETSTGLTFAVSRVKSDGTLDTSFGTAGKADIVLPSGIMAAGGPTTLLVQPDGKIVLIGLIPPVGPSSTSETVVARLDTDGSADPTFGTSGIVVLDQATLGVASPNLPYAALQGDGKLVLAGTAGNTEVTLVRLDTAGVPDKTFGTDGVVSLSDSSAGEAVDGLAIQPDGRAVVLAEIPIGPIGQQINATPVLIRLNADGSRDNSLGQAGLAASGIGFPNADGLIVQPNGQLLVLGDHTAAILNDVPTLARLNPDGSLDKAVPLFATNSLVTGFALQPNGQVVLTGSFVPIGGTFPSNFATGSSLEAFRLNADLTPDATFGLGGLSSVTIPTPPNGASFETQRVAVEPDNQVILVGSNPLGVHPDGQLPPTNYVVARLTATGSAHPGDYTGDGIADPAIYLPSYGSFAIRPSSGGPDQIIPFGIPGPGQTIPAPGDYDGSGRIEVGAYIPASGVYAYRPADGGADVLTPFGIPGAGQTIPAPGDYFGTGQDDLAVYLPTLGAFAIRNPAGGPDQITPFGIPGAGQSIPVPGDYDGSGKTELAVYLPSLGAFAYRPANGGPDVITPFGIAGAGNSLPMPGDYDGSGRTELAVYLPALGALAYRPANGGADVVVPFGIAGAGMTLPMAGDYDGSGKTELGVYLPTLGDFAFRPDDGLPDVLSPFGLAGPGQTVPATTVVLSPFPGSSNVSAASIEVLSLSDPDDPLDFLPTTQAKKPR